ncbi:hypothetical protein [Sulfitobacter sp. 1A12779]|uniref:hypothetical protein n=1 Tax=Sulfitobacter sp. 1A12779 TaxID=3368599 RepID=UPI003745FE6C
MTHEHNARAALATDAARGLWSDRLKQTEATHGFDQGYKLLYSPWRTLGDSDLTFLSLNPGRAPNDAELRVVSDERGNSYQVERATTQSPITDQFLKMCEFLQVDPLRVLTGVVAPFRSTSWDGLSRAQRSAALDVGKAFWTEALEMPNRRGPIVVCSNQAARTTVEILNAQHEVSFPAGWGNIRVHRFKGENGQIVVHLPHLSRFRLFGRAPSEEALRQVFNLHGN